MFMITEPLIGSASVNVEWDFAWKYLRLFRTDVKYERERERVAEMLNMQIQWWHLEVNNQ